MDRDINARNAPAASTNQPMDINRPTAPMPPTGYNAVPQASVPQPVQAELPPKKSKVGKIGLVIGIVIVIIALAVILMMAFGKKASGSNKKVGSSDAATGPKIVANAFIDDLQDNNSASAYHLESTNFQDLSAKQVELSDPAKYVPNVNTQMTGTATGIDKGQNVAEVAYKLDVTAKPIYVELTLEENNGVWQIDGFDSSYSPLTPSI